LAPGSDKALASALPPANDSFRRPQRPLGSAAVMAMPAIIGLSSSSVHSSCVRLDLSATTTLLGTCEAGVGYLGRPEGPHLMVLFDASKAEPDRRGRTLKRLLI